MRSRTVLASTPDARCATSSSARRRGSRGPGGRCSRAGRRGARHGCHGRSTATGRRGVRGRARRPASRPGPNYGRCRGWSVRPARRPSARRTTGSGTSCGAASSPGRRPRCRQRVRTGPGGAGTRKLSLNVTAQCRIGAARKCRPRKVAGSVVQGRRLASTCGCYRVAPMSPGNHQRVAETDGSERLGNALVTRLAHRRRKVYPVQPHPLTTTTNRRTTADPPLALGTGGRLKFALALVWRF